MTRVRATDDMVRLMIYFDAPERNSDAVNELSRTLKRQVDGDGMYAPDMFFLSPNQEVIAFVDHDDVESDAVSEGDKVAQVMQWYRGSERVLERADRSAERGRYAAAMEEVDELLEEDAKISHLIQQMTGNEDDNAEMPDEPVSTMFDGLREEKKAAYEALAQAELDKARAMVEAEELRDAQRLLRNLVRGPEDFTTTAPAIALMEEIVERLRRD